jgi:hypothetical protein
MIERYNLLGVDLPIPDEPPDIEWYKITKNGRLANGDMSMDFIATKRKINFFYSGLSQIDLDKIKNIINLPQCFFPFTYVEGNKTYTCTVYPGSLKYKKHRSGSMWYYQKITFSLIEK